METFLSVIMGISLSAAAGFRIFIPFLVMSLASVMGWIDFGNEPSWIGTYPALVTFSTASVLEIWGYYNPWIDNMLDLIATPLSIFAGIILASTVITDINPFLKWTLAIVCGGGAALNVQLLSVKARALSSFFTTGIGNPIVSTIESVSSIAISFLTIFVPLVGLITAFVIIFLILKMTKIAKEKIAK